MVSVEDFIVHTHSCGFGNSSSKIGINFVKPKPNLKKRKSSSVEMVRKTICSSDKKGSRKKHGASNIVDSSIKKKRASEGVNVSRKRGSKRLKVRIEEGSDAGVVSFKVFFVFLLIFQCNSYII